MKVENIDKYKLIKSYIEEVEIFDKIESLDINEIGDGNLNEIFRIEDNINNKSIIIKQAVPFLRLVGDSWSLTTDRNLIEAKAINKFKGICYESFPKIYSTNIDKKFTVMEDLKGMEILRDKLINQNNIKDLGLQLGKIIAYYTFFTSDLYLSPSIKRKEVGEYYNPELCNISEKLIFTDPFIDSKTNNISKDILKYIKDLWNNEFVKCEVLKLKEKYMSKSEALIHGDLHTGSIFVSEDGIKFFDVEFAFYGPIGFDLGILIGNMILNLILVPTNDYSIYLINEIYELWQSFRKNFENLFLEYNYKLSEKMYFDYYVNNIFNDMIGYAGCEIIRRIIGLAKVKEVELTDSNKKLKAIKLGESMITNREKIGNINVLCNILIKMESEEL